MALSPQNARKPSLSNVGKQRILRVLCVFSNPQADRLSISMLNEIIIIDSRVSRPSRINIDDFVLCEKFGTLNVTSVPLC